MKYVIGLTIAILLMLNTVTAEQRPDEEIGVERYPNLQAAITDIGAAARSLTISNAQTISSSLVIPANVALRITGGGQIAIPLGKTLTINGPFEAPLRQVFKGDGAVRWGSHIATVYPQWWGGKLDGAADDTAEIQAAIDSWVQTDYLRAGGEVHLTGAAIISSTLTIQKTSVKITGVGWGISSEAPKRGYIKWDGPAGIPMILIKNAYNSGVADLRLIGKSGAKPSAGIEYRRDPKGTTLLHHSYARNVFIGPLFGYDSDDTIQFDVGILISGDIDGDTNLFQQVHVNRCGIGVYVKNGNASLTHFDTLKVTHCGIGVKSNAFVLGDNWNFAGNNPDIWVTSGHRVQVKETSSEDSIQLGFVEVAGSLYLEGGSYEITNHILASGYIVDADQGARVGFKNFDFKPGPGYTYSPLYKIRVKSPGGGAGAQFLALENVTGIEQGQIDVTGPASTFQRTIVLFTRPPSSPNDPGTQAINFLTSNEAFDEKRFDVAAALSNLGGPFKVKALAAPAGLALTKVGSGTGTTYSYRVSAITADGETLASPAVTLSGNATLDSTHYIELTWYPVIGAVAYKVYGRTGGSEQLLGTRYARDIHNLPAGNVLTSFKDDGTVRPSGALPTANTTGNAAVAGTLSIGGGAGIAQVLSASATLDFPSTAAQTSSDLKINVTGAALGDVVSLGVPNGSVVANSSYTAWVSSMNVVTVRLNNYSGSPIDPAGGSFRAQVTKF